MEACVIDDECMPMLYCGEDNQCEYQYKEYEVGCANDFACENNLGCDHKPGEKGICIPYHSVPDHEEV